MLTTAEIQSLLHQFFVLAVKLGGPVLVISMAVGVAISIFQAVTQIHEQTLSFVPKLFVIGCILLVLGSSMLMQLQDFTEYIFSLIAR